MVTAEAQRLHLRKDNGLVRDVFQQHHMLQLRGNIGIGHVRYPTAGTSSCAEAQPLYTNYPYGICVAHNGNLTNTDELRMYLTEQVGRHVNTDSDSELLLNLFSDKLVKEKDEQDVTQAIFNAMGQVMKQCKGGYAGMFLINGMGLVGFRDPHGIRPLVFGCRRRHDLQKEPEFEDVPSTPGAMEVAEKTLDYVIASESVAIDTLGFKLIR